ncbi:hypothetical protein CONPUDRAFT_160544 [Coniophora puteana RWD-64-598 SS2]|uniref:Uncharacterized protein n=1 Tax=Coniophora puteana (strain RWD-64-598) TaxID=741705 RepID=R7SDI6_CONPW|nr:uncharacterized protein CONPUDRAFT_160544 [Coniophora puteana RWD-64-598 SS2]EIW73945.1 hypothetical protein CONPUDRAFT_160544 [Coniophora puteana RWD-64-598 SS2]
MSELWHDIKSATGGGVTKKSTKRKRATTTVTPKQKKQGRKARKTIAVTIGLPPDDNTIQAGVDEVDGSLVTIASLETREEKGYRLNVRPRAVAEAVPHSQILLPTKKEGNMSEAASEDDLIHLWHSLTNIQDLQAPAWETGYESNPALDS